MNKVSVILLLSAVSVHGTLTTVQKASFENNGWTITEDGSDYLFQHTGVVDSDTYTVGRFPSPHNPNEVQSQNYRIYVPKTPTTASSSSCTPGGLIGMAINGAAIFNPLNREGKDAVEGECAEVFDTCQGHPDNRGTYHYHQIPGCVESTLGTNEPIGIALDGYLIYPNKDESGNALPSTDLDECGGRTGTAGDYRYHMQRTYPYTMGCFMGTLSNKVSRPRIDQSRCLTYSACGDPSDARAAGPMLGLIISSCLLWMVVVNGEIY